MDLSFAHRRSPEPYRTIQSGNKLPMDRVTALLPKPPTIKELSTVLQYVN